MNGLPENGWELTDMSGYPKYVKVLLPLAFYQDLVYGVPETLLSQVEIGKRAEIQMGKNKVYAGLIIDILKESNIEEVKPLISVLDNQPIVNEKHLKLWSWLAEYYLCSMGEVMQAALPAVFKLDSTTVYIWIGENVEESELNFEEWSLFKIFQIHRKLNVSEIKKYYTGKSIASLLKKWQEFKWIEREELLEGKYKSKTEKYLRLNPDLQDDYFTAIKSTKQRDIVDVMLLKLEEGMEEIVKKELLQSGFSASALKSLTEKGIVLEYAKDVDRINPENILSLVVPDLTEEQNRIFSDIKSDQNQNVPFLLHGITASGKTMIYIRLVLEALAENKQVLWLMPEIALTTQMIERIRVFIPRFLVYHSRYNDAEQAEIWNRVNKGEPLLILGTRSSVFLPMHDLGLIIVDEEHDSSYKQSNPSPRYNGRDVCVYMAKEKEIPIVLGSATPSIESFYNADSGKYRLLELNKRYSDLPDPKVQLVDIILSKKKRQFDGLLTQELKLAISETLAKGEKVILFHNRRGYAPYLQCESCGFIPMCRHCDVSMTYHKFQQSMLCHYCGYKQSVPNNCTECGHDRLKVKGLGTQRIEEEIALVFRDYAVGRMDYDSTRGKHGHDKVIKDFETGKWDILVGTQMVTKGLEFENVTLVGVLNADVLFTMPDYKTMEKAYQLLVQVIGRSGRRDKLGRVIIQTTQSKSPLFEKVIKKDFKAFYKEQLAERKAFIYPPFVKLIKLTVRHKDKQLLNQEALELVESLSQNKELIVLGPVEPLLSKIDNLYIQEIYVKIKRNKNLIANKVFVKQVVNSCKKLYTTIDVDN